MDVSTDLIKTFLTLSELRSFSKAAKKLYKSQAAVSTQIALLEERAGLKLFDRSERPLELTEAGRMFLNFSSEFWNKLDELDRSLKELASGMLGEVNIAASTSVGTYLLPKLVAAILKKSPKLRITISVQRIHEVCESVRRADRDFGIILTDKPPNDLLTKPLKKEPLYFIVSGEHALANKKRLNVKDLQSVPFILGESGSEWHKMIDRKLQQNGIYGVPVGLSVNNYQAMKEAVQEGVGVAILSQHSVGRELRDGTLCNLRVANVRLEATIMLIERKRHLQRAAVTAVKTFLETNISRSDSNF